HTAKTLRNLGNIMASKEDLRFTAVGVSASRAARWCKKTEQSFVEQMNRTKPTTESSIERIWYGGNSHRSTHYDSSRYHALNLHSLWQGKGIEFRYFNGTTHAGKIKTYIQLCLAISHQALTQKGASAKKTASANEKYTFRTWLLRMGMIGDEFETARKWLLENLSGDIAFKNGRPRTAA
ncbi:MAG: amidoligase family protein, partial [Rikenellaceae bacterium]|nr:amidoligase family protein [Rikenellaceae bacterium]